MKRSEPERLARRLAARRACGGGGERPPRGARVAGGSGRRGRWADRAVTSRGGGQPPCDWPACARRYRIWDRVFIDKTGARHARRQSSSRRPHVRLFSHWRCSWYRLARGPRSRWCRTAWARTRSRRPGRTCCRWPTWAPSASTARSSQRPRCPAASAARPQTSTRPSPPPTCRPSSLTCWSRPPYQVRRSAIVDEPLQWPRAVYHPSVRRRRPTRARALSSVLSVIAIVIHVQFTSDVMKSRIR